MKGKNELNSIWYYPCSSVLSVVDLFCGLFRMTDPYEILGLSPDSDDTAIRKRYLDLVKEHPPERSPEKFRAIRAAYDQLRDVTTRVRGRLFEPKSSRTIDPLIEEVACQTPRRRLSLKALIAMTRRS
jgi:hypothetical protein